MHNIDNFDDIDDYEEPTYKEDLVSPWLIAICHIENKEWKGSGVIINPEGVFITAGHNLKDDISKYECYYQGQKYEIKTLIHKEYDCSPDGDKRSDFAIGSLKDFKRNKLNLDSYPALGECKSIDIGTDICALGYKSLNLTDTETITSISIFDQSQNKEICLYKQRIHRAIIEPPLFQVNLEGHIKDQVGFFLDNLNNKDAQRYGGFSGGPIYKNQTIYGLILSYYFLKSDYIKEILDSYNIVYRKYNEFEDATL